MRHIVDKDTGLCVICNRLEIAAIKEGKKYRRQDYDVRKLALENITHKDDPEYRKYTDRHYVKYRNTLDESKSNNKKEYDSPRSTFTKKLPLDDKFVAEKFVDNYLSGKRNEFVIDKTPKNEVRDTLRKINIANASRLNKFKVVESEKKTKKPSQESFPSYTAPKNKQENRRNETFAKNFENDNYDDYDNINDYIDNDEDDDEPLYSEMNTKTRLKSNQAEMERFALTPEDGLNGFSSVSNYDNDNLDYLIKKTKNKRVIIHHHYNDDEKPKLFEEENDGIYYIDTNRSNIYPIKYEY